MIERLLRKFGYYKPIWIKEKLQNIIEEIKIEIDARPQYSNTGKKGCLRRIQKLFDELK